MLQNIEVQNDVQDITIQTASPPVANIFESSETDLPPSYTECVISSPPNKVQILDSEPPPSYYVWIEQFLYIIIVNQK